jgi:hypothetical protein
MPVEYGQYMRWLMAGVISDMLIADMRHYLGEDLSSVELPAPAAKLRDYLGSIVAAVTLRNDRETDDQTPISCRRHPCRKQCEANIMACFDEAEPSAIRWFCPLCGDGGYIRGWQGTAWDKTAGR